MEPGPLHVLTADEEVKLLTACGEPLRLLAIFALDAEMRSGEMYGLTWSDVDLEAGIITVADSEAEPGKTRQVKMTSRMIEEAQNLKARATDAYVIPKFNFKPMWDEALKDAELPHFQFWLLRRTAQIRKQRS